VMTPMRNIFKYINSHRYRYRYMYVYMYIGIYIYIYQYSASLVPGCTRSVST